MINRLLCLIADELVQKKIEELQEKVHLDQNIEGAYLTHLLLSDQMTVTEILGSITELLLAGVDTVSRCTLRKMSVDNYLQSSVYIRPLLLRRGLLLHL